jgi:DNA-binding response OmpR family regulator
MKILLVDDDQYIASILSTAIKSDHYQIETTNSGLTALELVKTFEYDLLIVDVLLPGIEGINLCRQLRSAGYEMPILILSVKDSTQDRIRGLEAGADDYLVKPFEISELIARIHALLRRRREILPKIITWEKLQLDTTTKKVLYAENIVHLTPKEYALLELFLHNPSRIFSRDTLLNLIWSNDDFPSEEAVTTQIKGLRQKLKAAGMTVNLIQTIYGLGYRLQEQREIQKSSSQFSIQQETVQKNQILPITSSAIDKSMLTPGQINTMAVIASLHQEYQENLKEKLELFLQVVLQLLTKTPDPNLLEQAEIEAHRLAGSLGSFGLPEGSKVSREIEILLQNRANTNDQQEVAYQLKKLIKKLEMTLQELPSISHIINNPSNLAAELLIIDDDVALADRINAAAKTLGLQVKIASSLEAAKALISQSIPDVILLDIFFSNHEENTLDFLAKIREENPEIPVLIFTSHN